MRGEESRQPALFSYISLEDRVPKSHPLRKLRALVDGILASMSPEFDAIYSNKGRPSIAPERLLRALLLQVLYSVRSERMLVEQMEYNLLFRWFVGLGIDERVFDPTVFSHNRERLLNERFSRDFFGKVKALAQWRRLMSDEHFTVDGSLIEAWASIKSFRPKNEDNDGGDGGRNPSSDFHGERRSNETHESTTDPESRLFRKSKGAPAKLSYMPHLLTENRNGLIAEVELTIATGMAEREAALAMLGRAKVKPGATVAADKAYDTQDFVAALRQRSWRPHVAQNTSHRRSAIDGRTTRHAGYRVSQRRRKLVEEAFGWMKTVGGLRKTRFKGRLRVAAQVVFAAAAYNLTRMMTLLGWREPEMVTA
jgi:transposase